MLMGSAMLLLITKAQIFVYLLLKDTALRISELTNIILPQKKLMFYYVT